MTVSPVRATELERGGSEVVELEHDSRRAVLERGTAHFFPTLTGVGASGSGTRFFIGGKDFR
jgi:hypothetical protein